MHPFFNSFSPLTFYIWESMTSWIIFETITGLWPLAKATQYRQKYLIGGKTNYLM
jgi:nitrate reductase alpha subunit